MKGYAVLALASPSDGLAQYSNASVNPALNATSFRGAFLKDLTPHFGEALFEEAHQNMLPDAFFAFGKTLESLAMKHAHAHGLEALLTAHDAPEYGANENADVVHLTASAARWCLFWSARGHWLNTDW